MKKQTLLYRILVCIIALILSSLYILWNPLEKNSDLWILSGVILGSLILMIELIFRKNIKQRILALLSASLLMIILYFFIG
jgi:hypothetical protein